MYIERKGTLRAWAFRKHVALISPKAGKPTTQMKKGILKMLKDFKLLILWNMFHNMLNIVLGARSFHNETFIYFNAQIFLFSPTTIFLLSLSFLYLSFMNKLFGSFSLFPLELRINYEINFSLHTQDESFTFYSY